MTTTTDAGWAFATKGRKAHYFNSNSPTSVCGRFETYPGSGRRADAGVKLSDNCAACDRYVQEAIRNAPPVESPRDLARRALAEHAILAEATRLSKETDARLKEALGQGGRLTFGETEGDLGMVYTTAPKGTWKVVDDRAFLAWVKENAPHGIVEAVDPLVQKSLLARGADPATGEIPDGIEFVVGGSYLTVTPAAGAKAVARQLVNPIMPEVTQ